ncbi:MAG TPA: GNAT family N-acetyltransferase [Dehalococcoidia bacterium]|nr:GNAT family N-acetyltransferase [Dehalococcoidia bacterium]
MPQRALEVRDAVGAAARARLRPATPDDVAALVPLINAAYDFTEHHVFPGSRRTDRHDITKLLDRVVVAEVDGRIAACIHIDLSAEPPHYGLLAVDVSLHRSGLGSLLAGHAEAASRDAGASAIRIETVKQAGLLPFYERRGYRIIAETDGQAWNGGADWGAAIPWQMVDMEKELR